MVDFTATELRIKRLSPIQRREIIAREQAQTSLIEQQQQQEALLKAEAEAEQQELNKINAQISAQNKAIATERSEWEQAQAFVNSGGFGIGWLSPSIEAKARLLMKRKEYEKAVFSKDMSLISQGLKPVYRNGSLVGFEDKDKQMSYGLDYLPSISPEKIPALERAGIIQVTRTTTTPKEIFPIKENYPSFVQDKLMSGRTPDKKSVSGFFQYLNQGNQRANQQIQQQFQYEVKSSYGDLFKKQDYPSIIRKAKTDVGTAYYSLFAPEDLSKAQKQQIGSGFGTLFLGYSLTPFFQTGATATQKEIQKQLNKNKFDKLKKFLDDLSDELKEKPEKQAETLRKVKDFYKISDENFVKLVKELDKQGILAKQLVKIDSSGNIFIQDLIPRGQIQFNLMGVPVMKGAGTLTGVASAVGTPTFQTFGSTQWEKGVTQPKEKIKITPKVTGILGWGLAGSSLLSAQTQTPKTTTALKQPQATTTTTATATAQTSALAQPTAQTSAQALRSSSSLIQPQRILNNFKTKPTQPTPTKPIPLFTTTQTKALKKIAKQKSLFFTPEIKRFGSWISLKPEKSKELAKIKAISIIKSGLGASFRIRKGEELQQLDILSPEFRLSKSKTSPLTYVQKRQYRLSSLGERAEIKKYKKKKSKKIKWF